MKKDINSIMNANYSYTEDFGDKANLGMPPSKKIAILTCMDARLDPAKFAGLNEGEAHVIRNAGGRATDDAIRSLVISSEVLGTKNWLVIHHSECGMEAFTDEELSKTLEDKFNTSEGKYINWMSTSDIQECVKQDIERLKSSPLVSSDINISGYMFDVKTGKLTKIVNN